MFASVFRRGPIGEAESRTIEGKEACGGLVILEAAGDLDLAAASRSVHATGGNP